MFQWIRKCWQRKSEPQPRVLNLFQCYLVAGMVETRTDRVLTVWPLEGRDYPEWLATMKMLLPEWTWTSEATLTVPRNLDISPLRRGQPVTWKIPL